MSRVLKGVIQNGQIRLVEDPGLADGTRVSVEVEARGRSALDECFGAWRGDPSIEPIFEEIAAMRKNSGRVVPTF